MAHLYTKLRAHRPRKTAFKRRTYVSPAQRMYSALQNVLYVPADRARRDSNLAAVMEGAAATVKAFSAYCLSSPAPGSTGADPPPSLLKRAWGRLRYLLSR